MSERTVWAVLPVAGRSRRMHAFKPLLPLGGTTILEQMISRFHEAGIDKIVAVTGHRREEIAPLLERLKVLEVVNPDYAVNDMLDSVQMGVRAVLARDKTAAVLISPGDSPLIRPVTIRQVLTDDEADGVQAVIPCFDGRDGHPPLLCENAAKALLAYQGDGGLRGFISQLTNIRRIDTADAGILMDADTPEDYKRILKELAGDDIFE